MAVSIVDKLFFTKNLATLIKAGVPMSDALYTVASQSTNELKKVLEKVEKDVANGQTLANALGKHPKVFDKFFISLISAGEESGNLESNLGFLAEQMGKDYALRQKVKGAMMYPGLVLGATAIMGTGVSWFVLPKLIDLFTSFEVELPWTTKVLMGVAYFMRDYGVFAFVGMIGVLFALAAFLQIRSVKKMWHTILLDIPILGKIARAGELARFSRNLGVLLKSGLPVMDSLNTTINTLSNLKYIDDLKEIREEVGKGKSLIRSMEKAEYSEFDKLTTKMIGVGEKSGNLEDMLLYLSDYYDGEIDSVSKNLSTLLEPFLLLIIGLVVGFVAMAIISPIYSLIGGIS